MTTSAGTARAPFLVQVSARVCACATGAREMSRHRKYERARSVADGYWNVYLAFYGDQAYWLEFSIVDTRDGRLLWRNGRRQEEIDNGGLTRT